MESESIERAFGVPAPARLSLANIDGPVDIQPGEDGLVRVVAVKRLDTGEAERTCVVIEQAPNGEVRIETRFGERGRIFNAGKPCEVTYTVRVPSRCSIEARGVSSAMTVRGLAGDVLIETVSGDQDVAELAGSLRFKTVSGRVAGRRLSGPVDIHTVSGEVELTGCVFPSMNAHAVSGDLTAETPLTAGAYRFSTVSADVALVVPAGTRCVAEGASLSGTLRSALPVARWDSSGRRWRADLDHPGAANAGAGESAARVSFDSVSGNLVFARADGDGPGETPQAASNPQADSSAGAPDVPTRADILDRIARGELSVDEAVQAFDALPGN